MDDIGVIIKWNEQKGFGFISHKNGNDDVFFHVSTLSNRQRRPRINEQVLFELGQDNKGRMTAKRVQFIRKNSVLNKYVTPLLNAHWFGVLYWVLLTLSAWRYATPYWIPVACILLSIVTFSAYSRDKNAAQSGAWRTPENRLHFLALIGGWPGALSAQKILRHKSQKQPFKTILWLTIMLNCAAFIASFTPEGKTWVQRIYTELLHFLYQNGFFEFVDKLSLEVELFLNKAFFWAKGMVNALLPGQG